LLIVVRLWALPRLGAFLVVTALITTVAPLIATQAASASTSQGNNSWSGHVATTPSADCEFISQVLQSGNPLQPGAPRMDTYGSVDQAASSSCGNKIYKAAPGALSIRQDLFVWNPFGGWWVVCNNGPRIANDGFWTHSLATGYGWPQPTPCGNQYYLEHSYNFYNVFAGGPWRGSTHDIILYVDTF
jgi:hypothetical protein